MNMDHFPTERIPETCPRFMLDVAPREMNYVGFS